MSYQLATRHRCDHCGYEMFYTPSMHYVGLPLAGSGEPGDGPDPVCPKCWSEFVRKHCGILQMVQPVEIKR